MTGLIVDNFAGGGGASTGIEQALGRAVDIAIDRDARGNPITKTAQVAKCGNSVCPPLSRALVAANHPEALAQPSAVAA